MINLISNVELIILANFFVCSTIVCVSMAALIARCTTPQPLFKYNMKSRSNTDIALVYVDGWVAQWKSACEVAGLNHERARPISYS